MKKNLRSWREPSLDALCFSAGFSTTTPPFYKCVNSAVPLASRKTKGDAKKIVPSVNVSVFTELPMQSQMNRASQRAGFSDNHYYFW